MRRTVRVASLLIIRLSSELGQERLRDGVGITTAVPHIAADLMRRPKSAALGQEPTLASSRRQAATSRTLITFAFEQFAPRSLIPCASDRLRRNPPEIRRSNSFDSHSFGSKIYNLRRCRHDSGAWRQGLCSGSVVAAICPTYGTSEHLHPV